jgi:hypothetical protein
MTEVQQRLDELSKAFVSGHSRRSVLKVGLGLAGAAVAAAMPGRASAAKWDNGNGNSDCAHFCNAIFPAGPERGVCKSAGAHAEGLCIQCDADVTRICAGSNPPRCCPPAKFCCGTSACCNPGQFCCPSRNTCVTCRTDQIFDTATCSCKCPPGTEECGSVCRTVCPTGQRRNPQTCACEIIDPGNQPCEAFRCGGGLCATNRPGVPGDVCACFEKTEDPGHGTCLGNFFCATTACNTNTDCPTGFTCVTNTCCGLGVQRCAPPCPPPGVTQFTFLMSRSEATAAFG